MTFPHPERGYVPYARVVSDDAELDRRAVRQVIREVRARIWAWDPVGLAEMGAPEDEYDCLVGPVTGALREGLSAEDMAARLRAHGTEHFSAQLGGTQAFSESLIAWYHDPDNSILG